MKYRLYGMNVESEITLDEAYIDDFAGEPDLRVVIGEMPAEVLELNSDKTDEDYFVCMAYNAMVFRIPSVATYWLTAEKITVKPIAEQTSQPVKTFLLGSAFGYTMILRHMVVLHGGAVTKNGKGIIVTGESGAGKSTVTNSLREKNYEFIADDVCALSENGKKMHINMAYPQQKLCRDAALKMGYELSELIYINEERDKFAVRLKDGYRPEGMDFDFLFELVLSDDDELKFRKVEGHEKLHLLLRNIYRGEGSFENWGMPTDYMKQCLKIASTIEIYQIARPQNLNTLPEILDFIEEKLGE